jgi:hypothetical protein
MHGDERKRKIKDLRGLLMFVIKSCLFLFGPFVISTLFVVAVVGKSAFGWLSIAITYFIYRSLYRTFFQRDTYELLNSYKSHLLYHQAGPPYHCDCAYLGDWNEKSTTHERGAAFAWIMGEKSLRDIIE